MSGKLDGFGLFLFPYHKWYTLDTFKLNSSTTIFFFAALKFIEKKDKQNSKWHTPLAVSTDSSMRSRITIYFQLNTVNWFHFLPSIASCSCLLEICDINISFAIFSGTAALSSDFILVFAHNFLFPSNWIHFDDWRTLYKIGSA